MSFQQLLPLLIALIGGGGFVGLITGLLGRQTNKESNQLDLMKTAYERNTHLEKRNTELEVSVSELRDSLGKTSHDLMISEHKNRQLEEKNQRLEKKIKEYEKHP